jgi:hypothetical protein
MDLHEMFMAREQLLYDIECVIDSHFGEVDYKDEVIKELTDAVCNNFFIPQ